METESPTPVSNILQPMQPPVADTTNGSTGNNLIARWIFLTATVSIVLTMVFMIVIQKNSSPNSNAVSTPVPSIIPAAAENNFSLVSCTSCNVLRITEDTYNGPLLKANPEKVWEIEATVGATTTTSDGSVITVDSVTSAGISLSFTGTKIYQDLKPIDTLTVKLLTKENLDDGRAGGGTSWELVYYNNENQ